MYLIDISQCARMAERQPESRHFKRNVHLAVPLVLQSALGVDSILDSV
jgi:hypothetical protein